MVVHLADEAESLGRLPSRIEATPDVIEPMGDETFVYLQLSADAERTMERDSQSTPDQLLMSVEPEADVEQGRPVEVVFDAPAVHLFDTASGEALVHGVGGEARDAESGLQEPEQ